MQPYRPQRSGPPAPIGLFLVALFGVLVGIVGDRLLEGGSLPWSGVPLPTLVSVPPIGPLAQPDGSQPQPSDQMSSDPTERAIQQVIQQGDQEQAQAVASKDMSVMADTATSDFFQQQSQITQDLIDNGVTAIKLVRIEWGPVSVNGTTATATAWETWSTDYSDGTTDQSRDRNVYTLVQQNGTWLVQSDDHPDDVATGPPPGQPQPQTQSQPPTQPRVPRNIETSQNWAGYAATGGTFTAVSGTWNVPQFAADATQGVDATWVGIGGVSTRDLIQAGTQETVSGSGQTEYEAWVETLPAASHPVPLVIHPGDSITVSIAQASTPGGWTVNYTNNTTGQTYQVTEQYRSSLSSAEWVEEAPSGMRGRQLPLDNFGQISFSGATTTRNGQTVSAADAGAQAITMITRGGQPVAQPSALGADGQSFTVTRTSTPATTPSFGFTPGRSRRSGSS